MTSFSNKAMKDDGGYLRAEEINKIILHAPTEHDRLFIILLAGSGRRVSEVCGEHGIRPSDIDDKGSQIVFTILKKRRKEKPRVKKFIQPIIIQYLKDYIKRNNIKDDDIIFPFSRQRAFQIVRRAADRAMVRTISGKPVHPHHFRHSFVAARIERGVDFEGALLLRDYLEHSTITITESYFHVNPEREKKLFE